MAELKDIVGAKKYFGAELFDDLLNMGKSRNLIKIIDTTQRFVETEGKTISTSQVRNIYARIKNAKNASEMQLLRPLLAYASARQKGEGGKIIIALFDALIQKIDSDEKVHGFKAFAESVVAYHKYYFNK